MCIYTPCFKWDYRSSGENLCTFTIYKFSLNSTSTLPASTEKKLEWVAEKHYYVWTFDSGMDYTYLNKKK